jgi:thiol-disulfide isomerase/thioredoxin
MSPPGEDGFPVSRSRSWQWPLVVVLMAAAIMLYANRWRRGSSRSERSGPAIGARFTSFELEPLTEDTARLASQELRGSVVLVNFWGPWCHPCREEFPHLRELARRLGGEQRFRLVSVASAGAADDSADEIERLKLDTRRFLQSRNASFPVYCDPGAQLRRQLIEKRRANGFSFPTTVIIDTTGAIRGIWEGFLAGDERQMEELIRQLLDADADAQADAVTGTMVGAMVGVKRSARNVRWGRLRELPGHG